MSEHIDEVAARIRTAALQDVGTYMQVLGELWADQVEMCHVPPMPQDGQYSREQLISRQATEVKGLAAVIPDYNQEDVAVAVVGDEIHYSATMVGTLPDGRRYQAPVQAVISVRGGRLSRMETTFNPEAVAPLIDALSALGRSAVPETR